MNVRDNSSQDEQSNERKQHGQDQGSTGNRRIRLCSGYRHQCGDRGGRCMRDAGHNF